MSAGREGQCSWSVASKEEGGNMSYPEHRMWNVGRGKDLVIPMFLLYFKNTS